MGVSAPFAEMENAETVLRSEAVESGKLLAYSTEPAEFTERPKGLAAGNYLVRVANGGGQVSRSVVVR